MEKKYLTTLHPIPLDVTGDEYSITAQTVDTKRGKVLMLSQYHNSVFCNNIFIDSTSYFGVSQKRKQHKQTLSYIRYGDYYYSGIPAKAFETSNKTDKIILQYIKSYIQANMTSTQTTDPLCQIQLFIATLNYEQRQKANRKRADFQEQVFDKLPDLPPDIDKWVRNNTGLMDSEYIFMQPKKGKVEYRLAYCTSCEQNIEIAADSKHNEMGYCPKCRTLSTHKSIGTSRNKLIDTGFFKILQPVGDDVFLRYFTVVRDYSGDPERVYTKYEETERYYFNNKPHHWHQEYCRYDWKEPRKSHGKGWTYRKQVSSVWNEDTPLYNQNLEFDLKDTRFKHIQAKKYENHLLRYLCVYCYNSYIEYFIKEGLTTLTNQALFYDRDFKGLCFGKRKRVHQILGVSKETFNLIKKHNLKANIIAALQQIELRGYVVTEDIVIKLIKIDGKKEDWLSPLKYQSPTKLINYIERQKHDDPDTYRTVNMALSDYKDYIADAEKLDLDLTDTIVLRPKKLNDAHANTSALVSAVANAKTDKKIATRAKKEKKTFDYTDGTYAIVMPTSVYDLVYEGKRQKHCVGGDLYVTSHAAGKSTIFFVRRVDDIDKNFYTVEFSHGKIQQCRGYKNRQHPEHNEVEKFLNDWLAVKINKSKNKAVKSA